jgi:hypothetical protein
VKSQGYYELKQAFTEPGCALCRLLARHADGFVDATLYELVNDIEGRAEFNQARGYCNEHAWLLVRHGASLGAAILMDSVLGTVLRLLEQKSFEPQSAFSLRQIRGVFNSGEPSPATAKVVKNLEPQKPCPVCTAVKKSEKYYVTALAKQMVGPDALVAAYEASDGLCLPHFRLVLRRVSNENVFQTLVEAQKRVWLRLRSQLAEFIRKKDHRFKEEAFGIEGDSWLRAIEAVAGAAPARTTPRK